MLLTHKEIHMNVQSHIIIKSLIQVNSRTVLSETCFLTAVVNDHNEH